MFGAMIIGFAASLWNFRTVLWGSPAFFEEARIEGVFGQWRTRDNPSLYDRPTYLFQKGYGYLNADLIASEATEGADEIADVETSTQRAQEAVTLFEQSLRLDPANAHAWTALAWARLNTDQITNARLAMRGSWELAPYNAQLALDRLTFVDLLTGPLAQLLETPLSVAEKIYIARDMTVAERFWPTEFTAIAQNLSAQGVVLE
jgi:tetratricopeptide (TPR) repeat protein